MSALDPRLWLAIIGIAIAGIFGFNAWEGHVISKADKAGYARAVAEYTARALKAEVAAREEEQRRERKHQEIADDAQIQLTQARAAAAAAGRAADGLRQQLASFVSAAGADPATAKGGTPAGDPIGVLADVLERADSRAGILADYADRARIAGAACERAYDSLTPIGPREQQALTR